MSAPVAVSWRVFVSEVTKEKPMHFLRWARTSSIPTRRTTERALWKRAAFLERSCLALEDGLTSFGSSSSLERLAIIHFPMTTSQTTRLAASATNDEPLEPTVLSTSTRTEKAMHPLTQASTQRNRGAPSNGRKSRLGSLPSDWLPSPQRAGHLPSCLGAPKPCCALRVVVAAVVFLLILSAGVTMAGPTFVPRDVSTRGPRKLLQWYGAQEDLSAGEEGLYGDRIVTDRPHLAEAASTVGLGRVQIETGYTYYLDGAAGTEVQTQSFPEPLFRIGLFREWFEFRVQYNYLHERTDTGSVPSISQGSDDLYLGAKIALAEQCGLLPELTIFPQMRTPTGSSFLTSGEILPGMNFVYAWRLGERFEVECNTNVNKRRDLTSGAFYTEYLQTFNFEYDLAEQIMLFHEFAIFSPVGSQTQPGQAYAHAGFHWFLLPNLQIDVHAAVGLNVAADDFFGGSGLSARW